MRRPALDGAQLSSRVLWTISTASSAAAATDSSFSAPKELTLVDVPEPRKEATGVLGFIVPFGDLLELFGGIIVYLCAHRKLSTTR